MNGDSVFQLLGIAARQGHENRNVPLARDAKDDLVPTAQSLDRQAESAQLVLAIRIGACAVGEVHVNTGGRLPCRIVVLLMKGYCEDIGAAVDGSFAHPGRVAAS